MCNMRIYLILMRYTENNVNFRKGCANKMFGENAILCAGILFLLSWNVMESIGDRNYQSVMYLPKGRCWNNGMKFENYRAKKQRRMVVMLSSSWLLDLAEVGRGVLGLRASSRTTWVEYFDFQLHPCLWRVIHANKICLHCLSAILAFKFSMHLVTEDSPWRGYATWNDLKMNQLLGDSFFYLLNGQYVTQ